MFTYKCVERLSKEEDIQTAVNDALHKDFLGKTYHYNQVLRMLMKTHRLAATVNVQ
jgi:hypothetical protein